MSEILEFFESGAVSAEDAMELIGSDVAFCDDLIADTPTCADVYQGIALQEFLTTPAQPDPVSPW